MKILYCLICVATAALAGCVTPGRVEADLSTWQGRSAEELTATWGSPDELVDAGNGERVYRYIDTYTKLPTYVENRLEFRCEVSFKTDQSGTITATGFTGDVRECRRLRAP